MILPRNLIENCKCCEFLSWDTRFFGYRIARVRHHRLDNRSMESVLGWCKKKSIECLYFLADSDDPESTMLVQERGFRLVEVRITMELNLDNWRQITKPDNKKTIIIRPTRKEDYDALGRIASNNFFHSRFYADQHFSREKCQKYYETWVRKSFQGRVDLFLVAEELGNLIGFITGTFSKTNEFQLELCSVKESSKKMGVGENLTRAILRQSADAGANEAFVVTQGRNVASQRMLQRLGFLTRSSQLYFHKWFL